MGMAVSRKMLADCTLEETPTTPSLTSVVLLVSGWPHFAWKRGWGVRDIEDEAWWTLRTSQPTLSRELGLLRWLWKPLAGMRTGIYFSSTSQTYAKRSDLLAYVGSEQDLCILGSSFPSLQFCDWGFYSVLRVFVVLGSPDDNTREWQNLHSRAGCPIQAGIKSWFLKHILCLSGCIVCSGSSPYSGFRNLHLGIRKKSSSIFLFWGAVTPGDELLMRRWQTPLSEHHSIHFIYNVGMASFPAWLKELLSILQENGQIYSFLKHMNNSSSHPEFLQVQPINSKHFYFIYFLLMSTRMRSSELFIFTYFTLLLAFEGCL